jgi:hypothetical protein
LYFYLYSQAEKRKKTSSTSDPNDLYRLWMTNTKRLEKLRKRSGRGVVGTHDEEGEQQRLELFFIDYPNEPIQVSFDARGPNPQGGRRQNSLIQIEQSKVILCFMLGGMLVLVVIFVLVSD